MEPKDVQRFEIAIAPWDPVRPPYTNEELVAAADALAPAAYIWRLNGAAVARYRVGEAPSARIEVVLTEAASTRLPKLHRGALYDVRFDGARRYVALGMERGAAAAVRAPVVHLQRWPAGGLVLRLGALQGAWYGWRDFRPIREAERIDLPELRAYFESAGALERI